MLQFVDETGYNPLPPGIYVTITQVINSSGTTQIVTQGYLTYGGVLNSIVKTGMYTATFLGNQAPTVPLPFSFVYHPIIGGGSSGGGSSPQPPIVVTNYRSPCLSPQGYADIFCELQPQGWYGLDAMAPSGVIHSLGRGFIAGHAAIDSEAQSIQEQLRLQTCQGQEIDTWAYDFVGPLFQRYQGESDSLYKTRIMLMINRPRCTINAIYNLVLAFYNSVAGEAEFGGAGGLSFGLEGSFNQFGGFNVPPPTGAIQRMPVPYISVFDGMTSPSLGQYYGLQPPQFVIQIGTASGAPSGALAFDLAGSFSGTGFFNYAPSGWVPPTLSSVAPDPRLGLMVNWLAKGGATVPLYLIGQL